MRSLVLLPLLVSIATLLTATSGFAAEFRRVSGTGAQGVVIPADLAKNQAVGSWFTRFWTPTDRDIQDLELRLPDYLKDEAKRRSHDVDRRDPAEVRRNLKTSARQYIGVYWRGRKLVFVNGFPLRDDFRWTRDFILVADGGAAFWSVLYDIEQRRFEGLSVNGVP